MPSSKEIKRKIQDALHPEVQGMYEVWRQWRLTMEGGRWFINQYLKRFSVREDPQDFERRKEISYCPAFAKSAVLEINNAIFQRLVDVTREGGTDSYKRATDGKDGGVDLKGSTMMAFIGIDVLPELLALGTVGVYVDAPFEEPGTTVAERGQKHPYAYVYWAEDIRTWTMDETSDNNEFKAVLLRDHCEDLDPEYGLPLNQKKLQFRFVWIAEDGFVHVRFFDSEGEPIKEEQILNLKRIPFVRLKIGQSLLSDASDYQLALTNMASADVTYAVRSNVPLYTEQRDGRLTSPHLRKQPYGKRPNRDETSATDEFQTGIDKGMAATAGVAAPDEINVGAGQGRAYGPGMDRPGFINPSPEPLMVSMAKQKQMKSEIRQLVHLAVSNLDVKMASAESKDFDNQGLEAGLSAIGLELEKAERKIAEYWALYESSSKQATVRYPENYSLRTEQDRFEEAKRLDEQKSKVPSATFSKLMSKRMAKVLVGHHATNEDMKKIEDEIEKANGLTADPETIKTDVEGGLVSPQTASVLRGYPEDEAEKAAKAHAERLAAIAAHQSQGSAGQARGIMDAGVDGDESKKEKAASGSDPTEGPKRRGKGQ